MANSGPEDVLRFWFGDLDDHGLAAKTFSKRWWIKDPKFDQEIRDRFEATYDAIVADQREDWLGSPRSRLAYIIVLDQFSRNMFRGQAKMYAADERAQRASVGGVSSGADKALATDERVFLYMPLMHSENMELQDQCLGLLERFFDECSETAQGRIGANVKASHAHRKIVEQWGRFPHRNDILGRESTPQECDFLDKPGSSF